MNTPNKLTMLRIILIPFFVVFLLGNFSTWSKWIYHNWPQATTSLLLSCEKVTQKHFHTTAPLGLAV